MHHSSSRAIFHFFLLLNRHNIAFMMDQAEAPAYVPGSCNIGELEIRRRYRNGYLGIGVALALMMIIHLTEAYHLKWLVFIPVFYGLSGFIQARMHFCYLYGLNKIFSVSGKQKFGRVENQEAIQKDRRTAWRIILMSFVGSLLFTWIYYQLPF